MTDLTAELEDVEATYEDLIGDLTRYGGLSLDQATGQFPRRTVALVLTAMRLADECPHCLRRFINNARIGHAPGCPVPKLDDGEPWLVAGMDVLENRIEVEVFGRDGQRWPFDPIEPGAPAPT